MPHFVLKGAPPAYMKGRKDQPALNLRPATIVSALASHLPHVTTASLQAWRNSPQGVERFTARRISSKVSDRIGAIRDKAVWATIVVTLLYVWYPELVKAGADTAGILAQLDGDDSDSDKKRPPRSLWETRGRVIEDILNTVHCDKLPWWPAPCETTHEWSASHRDGRCQVCGIVNDEVRVVVSFCYRVDWEDVSTDEQWVFTCNLQEWFDFLNEVRTGDKRFGSFYYDDPHDTDRSDHESLQCFQVPDSTLFEEGRTVLDMQITTSRQDAERLIATLHLPRVTPGWIKQKLQLPCEPGPLGRCFCDAEHPCTVGRSEHDDDEEEEEQQQPSASPCEHQWRADKAGGNCQRCGVLNNEARVVVSFRYRVEAYDDRADSLWVFTCLQDEWDGFVQAIDGSPELEDLPKDDARHGKYEWENLQRFRFPHNDDDDSIMFIVVHNAVDLEVTTDADTVELLVRTLRLPRVTPGFIKWAQHSPCEPGPFGRCFCDKVHPCTLGRSSEYTRTDDDEEEEPVKIERGSGKKRAAERIAGEPRPKQIKKLCAE